MSQPQLVTFDVGKGGLDLVGAPILLDTAEERAVHIAVSCFAIDLEAVTGRNSAVVTSGVPPACDRAIIVGTVGSALVKSLQLGSAIDLAGLDGRWEAFATAVVQQPHPDCEAALVIVGSDKRGAAYGLYTISEQIGVSPYYNHCYREGDLIVAGGTSGRTLPSLAIHKSLRCLFSTSRKARASGIEASSSMMRLQPLQAGFWRTLAATMSSSMRKSSSSC